MTAAPPDPKAAPTHTIDAMLKAALDSLAQQGTQPPTRTGADGLPLPPCPLCGAPAYAGAYRSAIDISHECRCCMTKPARYDAALIPLYNRSRSEYNFVQGLPDKYQSYARENLRGTAENREASAYLKAREWQLSENIYIHGLAGTGKSELAVSMAREMARVGRTAKFWNAVKLLDTIRDTQFQPPQARPHVEGYDVLVLDDIDKVRTTDYTYERLYSILEARWSGGKVTIFTSQFEPNRTAMLLTPQREERELSADPIASRMRCGAVFRIDGRDYR